uniref:Small VCP/p97-interacting protein n=1 Tax=Caligus clemensi TaxID=344056 RepID=C1C038_CALCM|nr:Small VCP/p97-interacting protein [Caligus clemensi]
MGNCFGARGREEISSGAEGGVSQDEMRRRQAEAAEKRMKQEDSRGLKDPENFRRKQAEKEMREKMEQNTSGEGGLKWTVGN